MGRENSVRLIHANLYFVRLHLRFSLERLNHVRLALDMKRHMTSGSMSAVLFRIPEIPDLSVGSETEYGYH
jgi:hypothetical protein